MNSATRFASRFATRLPLLALLAAAAAPLGAPVQAADDIGLSTQGLDYEVGASLVCDTQGQVERFVALFAGDAPSAIRVVNTRRTIRPPARS